MFNMSPLLVKACAAGALFIALTIFEIVTRASDRARIKSGEVEDMRKNNTLMKRYNAVQLPRWRWWSEAALIVAVGVTVLLVMMDVTKYQKYGAFYDDSWRMPDVEEHMLFESAGTEALQEIYDADPEGFDFDAYKVCLVRMGCEDCERVKETILALDDTFYVVFARSEIGKAFVERYGVTYIPSVAYHGMVLEMRYNDPDPGTDADTNIPELDGNGESSNGPTADDVPGMVDELLGDDPTFGTGHELQPGNPGTAAGIGIVDGEDGGSDAGDGGE